MNLGNPSKTHNIHSVSKSKPLIRIKTYPIELIFNYILENPIDSIKPWLVKKHPGSFYIDEDGNECKLRRARVYQAVGCDCVKCTTKAKFFALEVWPDKSIHFDLYGVDDAGDEVLMTIDHILAKSKGGKDHVSNYQPLCKICNELKSNS